MPGLQLDEQLMIVILPGILALVQRDDASSVTRAQRVGALFDIPASQMPFGKMFEADHPVS